MYIKLNLILLFPFWRIIKNQKNFQLIRQDIVRWLSVSHKTPSINLTNFTFLMVRCEAFRNLLYYRLSKSVVVRIYRIFYKPLSSLYFMTPQIGGGLFIQHGFATIIAAKSIGENCWINQQVTIGYSSLTDAPTIEDNVTINAGAKVIGNVTVGENSIIGAGAVVVKDVPANCTVVGSEAYIVRQNGEKISRKPL